MKKDIDTTINYDDKIAIYFKEELRVELALVVYDGSFLTSSLTNSQNNVNKDLRYLIHDFIIIFVHYSFYIIVRKSHSNPLLYFRRFAFLHVPICVV